MKIMKNNQTKIVELKNTANKIKKYSRKGKINETIAATKQNSKQTKFPAASTISVLAHKVSYIQSLPP